MGKLLREPLLHFIGLGALLFIGHGLWEKRIAKTDYTIQITPAEIQRQATIFASENRREPNDEDIEALLFAHVEEQVLMREAQRIGLDEDDTIIRRRLAQKMRFMISDIGAPPLPKEADLETWFKTNQADFITPETRSFRHIYFSPAEYDGDEIEAAAKRARDKTTNTDWQTLGNPFMLARKNTSKTQDDVTRDFGRAFAEQVFELPSGEWSKPIGSALGLHLVYIDDITPSRAANFKTARTAVEAAWQEQASRAANQSRLEDLIKKYKVIVED